MRKSKGKGRRRVRSKRKGKMPQKEMARFQIGPRLNLLRQLDVVSSRLRRFPELVRRLEFEGAPITAEKYLARLRKRKKELRKKILKIGPPRARDRPPAATFPDRLYLPGPGEPPYGEIPEEYIPSAYRPPYRRVALIDILEHLEDTCPVREGYVDPLAWRRKVIGTDDIHHDSEYGFDVDDSWFEQTGDVIATQWLDDDAAILRDDNPDSFGGCFEVYWELPKPACDVVVRCSISARHHLKFTNGADDGGSFATSVAMVHSNENGEFYRYDLDDIQFFLLGEVTLLGDGVRLGQLPSGTYDSGTARLSKEFEAKEDSTIRVCFAHFFYLWAQDGLVETTGTIGTHYFPCYAPGACYPQLKFVMTPVR